MARGDLKTIGETLRTLEPEVLKDWLSALRTSGATESGRIGEAELAEQARSFLAALRKGLETSDDDFRSAGSYGQARDHLSDMSRSRALQGFTPRETATFVLSLKQPLQQSLARVPDQARHFALLDQLLDELSLHTLEVFQKSREEVIVRQQSEISELSTPVIKLWNGILALPLIGTLDSQRTQVVMENLLEAIVQQSADIAIIDITGVPTVDTLTAQHLLKTIAAARLMGADCIISGIRPQIAQTMVHLGVELTVVSKATLADAFAVALARQGRAVVKRAPPGAAAGS